MVMRALVLTLALSLSAAAQTAAAHSATITLTDPNVPPINNYNIYRAQASSCAFGGLVWTKVASNIVALTYTDTTVTAGTSYCYYATSVSGGIESAPGPAAGTTIPTALPPTITVTSQ